MKTLLNSTLLALALATAVGTGYAVSFTYAKIEMKGGAYSKVVKFTCADGTCSATVGGLKSGSYTITVCDKSGYALRIRESPTKASTGQTTVKVEFDWSVKSPRDVATGQSSGKRQYAPVIIRKELGRGAACVAAADLDSDGAYDVSIKATWADGKIMAMDDWEAPSN